MTIRKQGHMDSARSHVQGLLPYVLPDGKCHFPDKNDTDGNFGQYVCDFGLILNEDEDGGDYGREISVGGAIKDFDGNVRYRRFRYLDFARIYSYTKKQIRDGIIVKQVTRDVIVGIDCDGNPIKESKKVWTDKLDINEAVEPYNYIPINYYGLDSNEHRTAANFAQEGNYGFVFTNQSGHETEPDLKTGEYGLIVGIFKDDGIIYSNQEKIYSRDENNTVYWEYPDTAGKIKNDCDKWKQSGFSVNNNDDYWTVCKDMEKEFIGYLDIPQDIDGSSVPDRIAYSDIKEWLDWFDKHPKESCCYEKKKDEDGLTNIEDKEWTAHGGDKMRKFLKGKEGLIDNALYHISHPLDNHVYLVPEMDFPLLLTEEYRDTGLWTVYEDSSFKAGTKINAKWWEADLDNEDEAPLYIESQLQSVRSEVYYSDDNGSLPGLFATDGGYYQCRYRNYWEYTDYSNPTDDEKKNAPKVDEVPASATTRFDDSVVKTGDGDDAKYYRQHNREYIETFPIGAPKDCYDDYRAANNSSCYYAATIVEEAIPILHTLVPLKEGRDLIDGDYIQLLAKYKAPLTIPYIKGEVHNFHQDENGNCFGDYVADINIDGDSIIITYNIGGQCTTGEEPIYNSGYGIMLQDTYKYEAEHTYTCQFEDYLTDIKGEYIDFEHSPSSITVENPDLGSMEPDEDGNIVFMPRTRQCNQARIIGLRTGDALNGTGERILFKSPENNNLHFPIKTDVNIELNRGAAAAFESYFKLSECNTMQDLENYQNNWFNI